MNETRALDCLCGIDKAKVAGLTSFSRIDIVCPKHDGDFSVSAPIKPRFYIDRETGEVSCIDKEKE